MIRLRQITSKTFLHQAIQTAFADDTKLVEDFHIKGGSIENCISDTYDKIIDTTEKYSLEWYEVLDGELIIGFSVICKAYSFLYSFGIHLSYRQHHVLEKWWTLIKNKLGGNFTCALWTKNSRAISFLVKNGMQIYQHNNLQTHLIYN